MRRRDRLLSKARNNPNSLRFREFEALLSQCGWTFDHQAGSHRIWYSPFKASIDARLYRALTDEAAKAGVSLYALVAQKLKSTVPIDQEGVKR